MSHNWKKTQFMELALPTTSLQLGLEFTSAVDLIALLWQLSFLNIRFVVRRMCNSFSCHVLLFRPLMCWRVVRRCGCLRTFLLEQRWSRFCRISLDERLGWFLGGFTLLPTSGTISFLCRRPYRSQSPQTNVPGTRPECIS